MKEMAVYLMLVLGGNPTPSSDDVKKALSAVGLEADSAQLSKLISDLEGKELDEVIKSGTELLAKFGGGGAAEAEAEEEEPEEEVQEAPAGGGLFGDDGGAGGDY
eukprot:CAMPEP_0113502160 /NCGR_PEP_ID=MMETSP0014_2-20120614/33384_1 /TAXON_ID=2857 /ORGANISM="Nitzschia sp." /LENGTH=104 /DNA_ID=CAMNT_0000396885 /DNA_START=43 /DNA_END=357 /DNA_ORIENTATION=- /assembly_acc=CAM_ASM_000159